MKSNSNIEVNELTEKLQEKLFEIDRCIKKNEYAFNEIGVLSGTSSLIVFNAYMYLNTEEPYYLQKVEELINTSIELVNDGYSLPTFCSGISGFAWTLYHLVDLEIFTSDQVEFLNEFDEYLSGYVNDNLEKSFYDYLHGVIGTGIYYIKKYTHNEDNHLIPSKIIAHLDENYLRNDLGIYWKNSFLQDKSSINLSLSHGQASILIFLTMAYEAGIEQEKTKKLIVGVASYILHLKRDINNYGSYFSHTSTDIEMHKSRLAWCYGDLGIAIALLKASKILGNEELRNQSIEIFSYNALRRDTTNEMVVDAGICHGSAGLAHIFYKVYIETGIEQFNEAHLFWQRETLKQSKHEDGLAGYMCWTRHTGKEWITDYSIIEGVSGIALSFMPFLFGKKFSSWDESILLKF